MHVDPGYPLSIGCNCTIGDNTLIGMGATILNGARVGRNCLVGEHQDLWGFQAAATDVSVVLSLASPGCQRSNIDRSVPSNVRVRVCSRRCAPRLVHCIC